METIVVEIKNKKARKLLEHMESEGLITIEELKSEPLASINEQGLIYETKKPSDFFGVLAREEGEEHLKQIEDLRNEWERDI